MKTFLAVIAKTNKVEPYISEAAEDIASKYLFCSPGEYDTEKWQSSSKEIIVYSWSNEPPKNIYKKHLYKNGPSALVMTGYLNEPEEVIVENILKIKPVKRRKYISSLGGLYSICVVDDLSNSLTVWNTITRIEPVYWAENDRYVFICTRALFVHLLVENASLPHYELKNFASFLNAGFFSHESTPYKNVHVLPPNAELSFCKGKLKIREINSVDKILTEGPTSSYYDELVDALIKSFLPTKKHSVTLSVGLTGGKDSRLIVAVLKYINGDFMTSTSGFPNHPDVTIARQIAEILGVPHSYSVPKFELKKNGEVFEHDILTRAKDLLWVTEGMMSAYQNIPRHSQFNRNQVRLGGHGGEMIRGGYSKGLAKHNEDYRTKFLNNLMFGYSSYLHENLSEQYQEDIPSWLKEKPKSVVEPVTTLDRYYLYYRTGRWSAIARSGYTSSFCLYQPFFDGNFTRLLYQIPTSYRVNDEVLYNLVKRLAPELLNIPFFNGKWNFEAKISSNVYKSNSDVTFDWRQTCLTDMRDAFYEQIFHSSAADILFQIVKRDKVTNLFRDSQPENFRQRNNSLLWRLYTMSVLLSNEWLKGL